MEINIGDHLSESEMKVIAEDVFRSQLSSKTQDSVDILVANAAYHIVSEMVESSFDEGLEKKLRDKTIQVINGLSDYTVFHSGDRYSRTSTAAYKLMEAAAEEKKALIGRRVERAIMSISKNDIIDAVMDNKFTVKISAE